MSGESIRYCRPSGFLPVFDRHAGGNPGSMHYCPGCGHGIAHKLIAEAIGAFGIQDRTVLISPVGCAVFAYCYFDCFGISVPHGRAPAVGTGMLRAEPEDVVISYQGDGDLGAIGFNHLLQTANRGENLTVIFVNNAIYGMTGGQMAPTTLEGQRTETTPCGRAVESEGFPLKVAEMVAALEAPVYVERVALSTAARIRDARAAVRKAIRNAVDRRGFSLVECLSGCPVNLKCDAERMNEFIDRRMTAVFPLGCFKDVAATREPVVRPVGIYEPAAVREALRPAGAVPADGGGTPPPWFDRERRIRIAGSGGQGVLSLGALIATMGMRRRLQVSWLPSYGPEMRGGTANCTVALSRHPIGSPFIDGAGDLLIALNQKSLERFLPELKPHGVLLCDESAVDVPAADGNGRRVFALPAAELAGELGNLKFANAVMLGALASVVGEVLPGGVNRDDFDRAAEAAIRERFAGREALVRGNLEAYAAGARAVKRR